MAIGPLFAKSGPIACVVVIQNPCGSPIATAMTPGCQVSSFANWFFFFASFFSSSITENHTTHAKVQFTNLRNFEIALCKLEG